MALELRIEEQVYVLSTILDGQPGELARLQGGAQHLLPGNVTPGEARLELAIETAEDWLMPHVARRNGQALDVVDVTGRLTSGLLAVLGTSERTWSLAAIEQMFVNVVHLTTGPNSNAGLSQHLLFVADLLLIRELAHHGQVVSVSLRGNRNSA